MLALYSLGGFVKVFADARGSLCSRMAVKCQLCFYERLRIMVSIFKSIGIVINKSIIILI